jgi:thioesterase domain-containing protein/acyl carrier protein
LQEIWEEVLEVRPIGIHDKFFALGGHSLLAVRLLAFVEKRFGTKLKIAGLFQNPTIAQLAEVLSSKREPGTGSSIVAIQPDGFNPPLWLVHGAGGGMFWGYNNLARHLGPDQPVFAFKSRGLDGQEELETIEALAEEYTADLRAFQAHGPYCLGGYCFGGIVAYEMARRLNEAGEDVPFLGLINSTAPNSSYSRFRWTPVSALKFTKNLILRSFYTWRAHPEKVPQFLCWKARSLAKRLGRVVPVVHTSHCSDACSPEDWVDLSQYSETERQVWQKHLQALRQYQPQPYSGPVALFRSPVHLLRCSFDSRYGWEDLALSGLNQRVIPGAHETLMEEPGVQALAAAFKDCLRQLDLSHT